jgi:SAM domain (Sterile alpha motif)
VKQIADWLGQLGLEQYAQRFAENEIDVSVLRYLTDQDLKDIGVPLGHRRKILAAIAEASGRAEASGKYDLEAKPKPGGAADHATPPAETTVDRGVNRRRTLTPPRFHSKWLQHLRNYRLLEESSGVQS